MPGDALKIMLAEEEARKPWQEMVHDRNEWIVEIASALGIPSVAGSGQTIEQLVARSIQKINELNGEDRA
jgi:hypothetical protein